MTDYEAEVTKKINVSLALLRLEYTNKRSGKFDSKAYSQALGNFHSTIGDIGLFPTDEFLLLGIEHLHELEPKHREMIKKIMEEGEKIEQEEIPRLMRKLVDGFEELRRYAEEKGIDLEKLKGVKRV